MPGMRWSLVEVTHRGITIINDAYNANPTSVGAAIRTFSKVNPDRRHIAILGDMLELGERSAAEHRAIGDVCAEAGIDVVFGYGNAASAIVDGAIDAGVSVSHHYGPDEIEIMVRALEDTLAPGDLVLLKGSRGMALERVVDYLAADGPAYPAMGAPDVR